MYKLLMFFKTEIVFESHFTLITNVLRMSAAHVFLEFCVGCRHEITFFTVFDLMRILKMLLKDQNRFELLLTVVTLFLLPGVLPRLVLGEMGLGDKALITEITFEILPGVEVQVGGEVGEHVHLQARPTKPPAHITALDWVEVVPGRILEFLLLPLLSFPGPRCSQAGFGDQMSDKAPLGGECAGAVCTNHPRHPLALTETAPHPGRDLEVKCHSLRRNNQLPPCFRFSMFQFIVCVCVTNIFYNYLRNIFVSAMISSSSSI